MRIKWDERKRREVLQKRGIDFAQLEDLFCLPYIEDQRNDDPEQYRIIGSVSPHRLITLIVEYREDHLGEFVWVVTAWNSTKQEKTIYEKQTT